MPDLNSKDSQNYVDERITNASDIWTSYVPIIERLTCLGKPGDAFTHEDAKGWGLYHEDRIDQSHVKHGKCSRGGPADFGSAALLLPLRTQVTSKEFGSGGASKPRWGLDSSRFTVHRLRGSAIHIRMGQL